MIYWKYQPYIKNSEKRKLRFISPLLIFYTVSIFLQTRKSLDLRANGFDWSYLKFVNTNLTILCFGLNFLLILISCVHRWFIDHYSSIPHPYAKNVIPENKVYSFSESSLFAKITFSWLYPILRRGYTCPLELADLEKLPEEEKAKKQFGDLKKYINTERPTKSILRSSLKMNLTYILAGGFFRLLADILGYAGALRH